jgi:NAD(P)H-flavin reductase
MLFSEAYANSTPLSTRVLFGARDKADLLYTDEFVQELGHGSFIQTLSRPKGEWNGFKGRVTDWLRHADAKIDFKTTDFYLCGNGAMIDEVKALLAEKGLDKSSIFQEAYYKPKPGETHA